MIQNPTSYIFDHSLPNIAKKGGRRQYLNKTGFETKDCSQVHLEQNELKIGPRFQGLKLKPLDVAKEFEKKSGTCYERKFLLGLNSSNCIVNTVNTSKRLPSKIPVLQRPLFFKNEKLDNALCDTSLSAADRRQKFHQSRLYVAPPYSDIDSNIQLQHNVAIFKDAPKYNVNHVSKMSVLHQNAASKVVLPPIKNSNSVLNARESAPQPRKKCLLGEITHFPAFCYLSSKPLKNFAKSAVPQLPPIFPLPVAPPPSISTSLEHDSTKVK